MAQPSKRNSNWITADKHPGRVILDSFRRTMIRVVTTLYFRQPSRPCFPSILILSGNDTQYLSRRTFHLRSGFSCAPSVLFFGRIGDLSSQVRLSCVTLTIMGGATALIGFLPTYATAGLFAPNHIACHPVLQGLALCRRYGGAGGVRCRHVPDGKRGFYTSFLQITATLACLFP